MAKLGNRLFFYLLPVRLFFEGDVVADVVEADVSDDFAYSFVVGGGQAFFYPAADELAEDAAEVFVAREGEEGARVGEHPDEAREDADVRERLELRRHAVDVG